MPLVSVTRLHLRSLRFLPGFIWYATRSARQARTAPGNLHTAVRRTADGAFWTLTAWQDEPAMVAFRRAPPHREAMPKLMHWCDEAAYAHWQQDSPVLPSWDVAAQRLRETGKSSRVNFPSAAHRAGRLAP